MKFSRRWHWENTWLLFSLLALLVMPSALLAGFVPHAWAVYGSVPQQMVLYPLLRLPANSKPDLELICGGRIVKGMLALPSDGSALARRNSTLRGWRHAHGAVWDLGRIRTIGCIGSHCGERGRNFRGGMGFRLLQDEKITLRRDRIDPAFGCHFKPWTFSLESSRKHPCSTGNHEWSGTVRTAEWSRMLLPCHGVLSLKPRISQRFLQKRVEPRIVPPLGVPCAGCDVAL